ncbi:MAG: HAMP domain-containing sensor histidine kinase [Chloroflexota bacterium]
MFSSLRFRLWLTYALIVMVVVAVAGLAILVYLFRNPAADRRELQRLRVLSTFLAQRNQVFSGLEDNPEPARLAEAVARSDNLTGARVAVFNEAGELMADSRVDSASPLPDWTFFRGHDPNRLAVYRDEQNRQWLYAVTPLAQGGYLLLAAPRLRLTVAGLLRDEVFTPFVRGVALALALSLLLALWIAHWVTRPLQRIGEAARAMSAGEFQKIPLEGPGEVRDLARNFNEMGEKVLASQRSQRDFIANVSHDLKTPLTSIQGFAQAILDGTADDPAAASQAAQVIYDEVGRMHRMVQDLLELARLDSGAAQFERAALDLGELARGVVQKFIYQAEQAQVDLSILEGTGGAGTGGLITIIGDADRLGRVFGNLVDNAIKYSPAGGSVTVSVESGGGWAQVGVVDTGPGIPPEELERVFERFYQTDKSRSGGQGRGVGLGLAIAREIIQAHSGTIEAHNSAEGGSVFVVRLPVARPDDETLVRRR